MGYQEKIRLNKFKNPGDAKSCCMCGRILASWQGWELLNHRDDPNLKKGKKTLKSEELQGSNEYSVITLETVLEQRTDGTSGR